MQVSIYQSMQKGFSSGITEFLVQVYPAVSYLLHVTLTEMNSNLFQLAIAITVYLVIISH